ncbi:hypothetical protein IQ07DRAFT_586597 [Pyrenochaeta sp. DS3sAY3a]|nr:hypothetical protein IQ07DRAFT_586597 [Pyrenochaeta sp. DS3sAY3a]
MSRLKPCQLLLFYFNSFVLCTLPLFTPDVFPPSNMSAPLTTSPQTLTLSTLQNVPIGLPPLSTYLHDRCGSTVMERLNTSCTRSMELQKELESIERRMQALHHEIVVTQAP